MQKKLIFDVGMHMGEDTAFYLKRGYKVVGVEANPILVSELKQKFSSAIASGDLVIVDKAVAGEAGEVDFHINDKVAVWGSIDPVFITRNARRGSKASRIVRVACATMAEIVGDFPEPHYIKIDIEGMDMVCLESLAASPCRPKFISLESSVSTPVERIQDELNLLGGMGYDSFKYVDQSQLSLLDGRRLDLEGDAVVYEHTKEASGPFGAETPGDWLRADEGASVARLLRREFETYSKGSNTHILKVRINRLMRSLRGLPVPSSWYDLHAMRAG